MPNLLSGEIGAPMTRTLHWVEAPMDHSVEYMYRVLTEYLQYGTCMCVSYDDSLTNTQDM